jgi:hypothetical protein
MPRAQPFTRTDLDARAREKANTLDPDLIEKIKLILKSDNATAANVERLASEVAQTIQTYNLTVLADHQESPARIVAALKPGLPLAKGLREWLEMLPQSVRFELKTPEAEALFGRIKEQLAKWQAKVRAGPIGRGAARNIRQSLSSILAKDIANERKRRKIAAHILAEASIDFPNEKKNRKKFIGS